MHGLQTGIQFTVRCKMVSAFDTLTLKVLAHTFFHLWCLIFYQNKNKNSPFVTLFIVRLYRQVHEECLIKKLSQQRF